MKSRKNMVIGVLCLTLVFMGLGYAAFSSILNLSGTATASGTFDVKITNVVLDSENKTEGATNLTPAVGENYAVTEQSLIAQFSEPGDYITWNITVTNRGTIEAAIIVDVDENTSGPYKLICDAVEGTILAPNQTTTFACEMSFDKNRSLTAEQFAALSKGTSVNMSVHVTAVQATEYTAPEVEENIFVGKTFYSEDYNSDKEYYRNVYVKNITDTTLDFNNNGTFVTVPYTYDETTHTISVANGMYLMNVIELDDNIIIYNNDLHAFLVSNSNAGMNLLTGYTFNRAGTIWTFDLTDGHPTVAKDDERPTIYYLIDTSNGDNGEILLIINRTLYTVTKTNGVYTSFTDGTDTYTLIPPTP